MMLAKPYAVPHLPHDDDGFVVQETSSALDRLIEEQVRASHLTTMEIDLRAGPHSANDIQTVSCSIHPADKIPMGSPVFDVLYHSDYLFKFIYRYLVQLVFRDKPAVEAYLIATKLDNNNRLVIAPTTGRAGFTALKNEITLFARRRPQSEVEQWRVSYNKYKGQEFQAQLCFTDAVDYCLDDDAIVVKSVFPKVRSAWMDSTPLPHDHPATVLHLFVDEHYARLRRAFPVYQHLETAVQLCVVNQVARSMRVTDHPRHHNLVPVGEFVDCVYHVGGIVVDATPRKVEVEKIRNDPCRKAFNRGGFICAFAPALVIEDCLDKNEQDYLQCLKE